MENYTLKVFDLNSNQITTHILIVERELHTGNGVVTWNIKFEFAGGQLENKGGYLLSASINKIREIIEPKGFRLLIKGSDYDAVQPGMLADASAGTHIFKVKEKKTDGSYTAYHILDESDILSVVSLPKQRENKKALLNLFKKKNFILRHPNYKGTLTALFFCISSVLSLGFPIIQISSVLVCLPVLYAVQFFLSKLHLAEKCSAELVWTSAVFIVLSLGISIAYYRGQFKNKRTFTIKYFFIFLLVQFFILQTPFLIFDVGTYYNCGSDGQTLLAVFISSPKVSVVILFFGIIYDILAKLKNKEI